MLDIILLLLRVAKAMTKMGKTRTQKKGDKKVKGKEENEVKMTFLK